MLQVPGEGAPGTGRVLWETARRAHGPTRGGAAAPPPGNNAACSSPSNFNARTKPHKPLVRERALTNAKAEGRSRACAHAH